MDLATKLQLKPDQPVEYVAAPAPIQASIGRETTEGSPDPTAALLVFTANRAALERRQAQIVRAAGEDRLTWVAYPKAGQLETDLNRDSLAALLIERGVHPVRQVALDEVWSALRFRHDG